MASKNVNGNRLHNLCNANDCNVFDNTKQRRSKADSRPVLQGAQSGFIKGEGGQTKTN